VKWGGRILSVDLVAQKHDELVKSLREPFAVIPAKAGIQYLREVANHLDSGACPEHGPGFAGVTTFYELVKHGAVHRKIR
jgi:hypothetical protein